VIGCGTSGHGFKFGPLFGQWLADLATGSGRLPPPQFRLGRFSS
jgi:glycine/D-amino acid oxidase-like deaminating enzyme